MKIEDRDVAPSTALSSILYPLPSELRGFLAARLPAALVPSAFVLLDALPLTPNGKLDRRALPAPASDPAAESYVAPRTPLEATLAALWSEVLQVERVSVEDNFFTLGGHSILIMQLIAQIEELFPIALPVRVVFEAPTLGALATVVDDACRAAGADPNIRARLLHNHSAVSSIRPRPAQLQLVPLSYAQQRLWFIQQLDPANVAYNIRSAMRLVGRLDLMALQQGLHALVRRHEILRTVFLDVAGEPAQQICPTMRVPIICYDLRALPPGAREVCAGALTAAEGKHPFDLAQGPLIRATLLRFDDAEFVLLLTLHHIVCDAWSLPVIGHELAAHYHASLQGERASLPPLPIQYADFAYWQRTELTGERIEAHMRYWRRSLAGAPELLALPTDRPRPPAQTFRGAVAHVRLPDQLAHALQVLSQRENATLAMILLAAWQVLLARYAGQTDIVVSTSRANRRQRELEALIGPLYAIVLLRADLSDRPSFRQFVGQTRRVALEAYEHDDVPFEQLVERLKPTRDPSYAPLAQVMFVFHNTPVTPLRLPGIQVVPFGTEKIAAQYDLLLRMSEQDGMIAGQLEYNIDLFDAATIERMAGHFGTLLEHGVTDPGRSIFALTLLSEHECEQLRSFWYAAPAALPDLCWPQLFEAQVARTPDAIACLTMNDEEPTIKGADGSLIVHRSSFIVQLSYTELNARGNRLAHALVAQGVGPEVVVGLLAQRNIEFLISLIAILKAGGVYLPLDPSHFASQIAAVLAESRCTCVLAAPEYAPLLEASLAELPPDQRPTWMALQGLDPLDEPTTNLAPRASLHNLAYVLFTSGSTGMPKGAMVEYAGMLNHMRAKTYDLQLSASDTLAQNAPQSFDVSVWQFLAALLVGGRVLIVPDEVARDPSALLDALTRQSVSLVQMVPSLLQALVRELEALGSQRPALSALRWVVPTGDVLPSDLCRAWLSLYPHTPLLNNYGATECSDDTCHEPIHELRAANPQQAIMPLGRPIANTAAYILDAQLAPVPLGVVGEIYTAGVALGRGYLRNPTLTAERFVPNPFASAGSTQFAVGSEPATTDWRLATADCRLYKTGDLARYLPDGRIAFVGRSDARVKLHGIRIDLDAVAAALRGLPDVAEAVVLVRADRAGDARLVGFVVATEGIEDREQGTVPQLPRDDERRMMNDEGSNSSFVVRHSSLVIELRASLKERLPSYMIPSAFVLLNAMPLTPNGKLDRRALQTLSLPETSRAEDNAAFEAPQTLLEQRLAQVWARVLGQTAISRTANFFELGGDSFTAIRVVRQFGAGLRLLDLFQAPVLCDLAARISAGMPRASAVLQPLLPPNRQTACSLICVPYGGGSAIVYQPLAQALPPGYALYSVALPGHDFDSSAESLQSVEEVAQRCVEEIRANIHGPIALYGHCAGTAIAVEIARRLEVVGRPIDAIFLGGALPSKTGLNRIASWVLKLTRKRRPVGAAELLIHLRAMGGFTEIKNPEELSFALRGYVHDDEDAAQYFGQRLDGGQMRKLQAPIICLMGERDPTTRNYARRYTEWGAFSQTVRLAVVHNGNHYFIRQHAAAVAQIIQATIDP